MTKFTLYVGSNNKTGQLERDLIVSVTARHFDAFTIIEGMGCWKGILETTAIITILSEDYGQVDLLARDLKVVCNQECILVEAVEAKVTFI